MSSARRLRATLEDLGGLQRLAARSGPARSVRETLACGSIRRAGNGGWYWEVNDLLSIRTRVVPFFERFPLVGAKARDFDRFRDATCILERGAMSDADYVRVLMLREDMNRGGKRRYSRERILRDYTPSSPAHR